MPDSKITALASTGTGTDPANDPLVIVDVSDTSMAASGTTKKVTLNNLLACSPTATLASATITGDLTVNTNVLKVDSTNDRVGIGTASPATILDIQSAGGLFARIQNTTSTADAYLVAKNTVGEGFFGINATGPYIYTAGSLPITFTTATSERYRIASDGVATWSNVGGVAGTAMTLNSTGLGVGMSASAILSVLKSSATQATGLILRNANGTDGSSISLDFETSAGTSGLESTLAGRISGRRVGSGTTGALDFFVNNAGVLGTAKMTIDSTGQVGIGVTPSAWDTANYKALQVSRTAVASLSNIGIFAANWFADTGGDKYIANGTAARIDVNNSGQIQFKIAPSGTAGNAITFTQAMTLDATGNLLVGTTDTGSNSGIGIKSVYSSTAPYVATVGSSTSASQYSYLLYSTGGTPAYKFYVSYSGQISATSGTVAALSDARFKENVQDIDVGLGAILALKPRKFDWKAGKGKNIKGDRGFIAQEFEQVFPNLIEEWADPAPEGEAPYKSVRQDLIPVLVKAIQELTARVEALEA